MFVGPLPVLPTAQKAIAVTPGQAPFGRVPSHQTEARASWLQWDITRFPPELLSRIFGCLGCDATVQVKGTCRKFREVVQADHQGATDCGLPK